MERNLKLLDAAIESTIRGLQAKKQLHPAEQAALRKLIHVRKQLHSEKVSETRAFFLAKESRLTAATIRSARARTLGKKNAKTGHPVHRPSRPH